ncbi:hypothetical protein [Oricola sp.]|uniref:hypothetical protein n=1 Tax=Oricola sp. TaxID=1979950 RepID=UPI003BA8C019
MSGKTTKETDDGGRAAVQTVTAALAAVPPLPRLAAVLAGVAPGETRLCGAADRPETAAVLDAMGMFGARHDVTGADITVRGLGNGCLLQAEAPVEIADDETACLIAGLLSAYDMPTRIALGAEPDTATIGQVLALARRMGAQAEWADDHRSIDLRGARTANPVIVQQADPPPPVVRAAFFLAALNAPGICGLSGASSDIAALFHAFGAELSAETGPDGGWYQRISGQPPLAGTVLQFA